MDNFFYSVPTKVAFGKGEIKQLPSFINEFGKKVLIVYGGGSIKRIGVYDKIIELLGENGISYIELSGVEPNPEVSTVRKGIEICKKENVDVVLPVGGGSTIDCAKAIAAGSFYRGDVWELVGHDEYITKALPVIAVLTIAATGSEMDCFSVITNKETKEKEDISSYLLYPKYSILDPEYTYSVSKYQTACGTVDMISHVFEVYFNGMDISYFNRRIMEGIMKTCFHYGPAACNNPSDYEARANLMWAASWAINGLIACGNAGPWPIHSIEHQLSASYNVTHGHGLAVLIPHWLEYILSEKMMPVFADYGKNVFGIDPSKSDREIAEEAVRKTKEHFMEMGLSMTLRELGIPDSSQFSGMAAKAMADGLEECLTPVTEKDIIKIYEESF